MQDLKKKKKIIIVVAILIIIFSVILIVVRKNNKETQLEEEFSNESIDYNNVKEEVVTGKMEFYCVVQIVQNFLDTLNIKNPSYYGKEDRIVEDLEIDKKIYEMLSEKYIKDNQITVDNIEKYINKTQEKEVFIPLNMKVLKGEYADKYLVQGFIEDEAYNKKTDVYIFVNKDEVHATYSIELINRKYNNINEILIENENKEILEKENNKYENPQLTDQYLVQEYFYFYKYIMLGNKQLAYEKLNKEYSEKRFDNYEQFEKYIDNHKENIINSSVKGYMKNDEKSGLEYVCIDYNGNYYVFKENENCDYEVMLDTYTVDLPEFIEKYSQGNNQQKVALNINKIFTAIDAKDYKYVYSKLAESFKNNYFNNESDLQKYLNDNLFEKNNVSYEEYAREGELYTYKVYITDNNNTEDSKQVKMNIVMQLKEGTDFVMSFSIEK